MIRLLQLWAAFVNMFKAPTPVVSAQTQPDVAAKPDSRKDPLNLSLNTTIRLNSVDFMGKTFVVNEIADHHTEEGAFCDYGLISRQNGFDTPVKLRSIHNRRLLALNLHEAGIPADSGIEDALNDRGGLFNVTTADVTETFKRQNGRISGIGASVTVTKDLNGDGVVSPTEVVTSKLVTYPYTREVAMDGATVIEHLYVDKTQDGTYSVWRGYSLRPSAIEMA